MKIVLQAIVSSTDMIKNYKDCREKAESMGKVFVFKNNQADAVLLSIAEYEKLSEIVEYFENLDRVTTMDQLYSLIKERKGEIKRSKI